MGSEGALPSVQSETTEKVPPAFTEKNRTGLIKMTSNYGAI